MRTCTVHDEICFEAVLLSIAGGTNQQPVPNFLNAVDFRTQLNISPEFAGTLRELLNKIWIKSLEKLRAAGAGL